MTEDATDVLGMSGGGTTMMSRSIGSKINLTLPEGVSNQARRARPYSAVTFGRPPSGSALTPERKLSGSGMSQHDRAPSGSGVPGPSPRTAPVNRHASTGRMDAQGSLVQRDTHEDSPSPDFTFSTSRKPLLMSRASVDLSMLGDPSLKNRPTIPTSAHSPSTMRRAKSATSASHSAAAWRAYGSPSARGQHRPPPQPDPVHPNPKNVIASMRGSTVSVGMLGGGFLMPHPRTAPASRPLSAASGTAPKNHSTRVYQMNTRPSSPPLGPPPDEVPVESPRAAAVSERHAAEAAALRHAAASGFAAPGYAEPMAAVSSSAPASPRIVYDQELRSLEILAEREGMHESAYFPPSVATDPRTKEQWMEILRKKQVMAGNSSKPKSARGERSQRFTSTSITQMHHMGVSFQPYRVSGFSNPAVEVERPNPEDPSWATSRVGQGLLDRMKQKMQENVTISRPYSAPVARMGNAHGTAAGTAPAAGQRVPSAPPPPRHPPPLAAITEEDVSRGTTPLPREDQQQPPWLSAGGAATPDPAAPPAPILEASSEAMLPADSAVDVLGDDDDGYVQEDDGGDAGSGEEDEIEAAIMRAQAELHDGTLEKVPVASPMEYLAAEPAAVAPTAATAPGPEPEASKVKAPEMDPHPIQSSQAHPTALPEQDGDALAGLMGKPDRSEPAEAEQQEEAGGFSYAEHPLLKNGSGCQSDGQESSTHAGGTAGSACTEKPEEEKGAMARPECAPVAGEPPLSDVQAASIEGKDTVREGGLPSAAGEAHANTRSAGEDLTTAPVMEQGQDTAMAQDLLGADSGLGIEEEVEEDSDEDSFDPRFLDTGGVPSRAGASSAGRPSSSRPTSARPTARPTSARTTSARTTSARPTSARPTSGRSEAVRQGEAAPAGGMQVILEADDGNTDADAEEDSFLAEDTEGF